MNTARAVNLLLRIGVAFTFIFAALNALFNPYAWIGYFPSFLMDIVPDGVLLGVFAIIELVIGLWILSGRKIFIPSLTATILLLGIVIFNPSEFDVLFRDLSIAAMALALTLLHRPEYSPKT